MYSKGMLFVVLSAVALGAAAQQVYRSVDEHGNVTFSSTPPPEAKEVAPVNVHAGPTSTQREEAAERERRLQEAARELDVQRAKEQQRRQGAIAAAEHDLAAAQARLDDARIQRDEDWQGLAGGGRRLKPSYYERVEQAEEAVRAAEVQLARARKGN